MSMIIWEPSGSTRFRNLFVDSPWQDKWNIRMDLVGSDVYDKAARPVIYLLTLGDNTLGERIAILQAVAGDGLPIKITESVMDDAQEYLGYLGQWEQWGEQTGRFVMHLIDRQKMLVRDTKS